jgi:hypothetical protein
MIKEDHRNAVEEGKKKFKEMGLDKLEGNLDSEAQHKKYMLEALV